MAMFPEIAGVACRYASVSSFQSSEPSFMDKQYSELSYEPNIIRSTAKIGEEVMPDSDWNVHFFFPSTTFTAYSVPRSSPKYTVPAFTEGEDLISSDAWNFHRNCPLLKSIA